MMSEQPADKIAEVVLRMGRWHLIVRGVFVAMQGDLCRDPHWPDRHWTTDVLEQAAALINEARWQSADDRFQGEVS